MPNEALISRVEQIFNDVAILGGKAETTSMVTGLEVVDISITGQPNLILVRDNRDGDFIYAVKVPGVIYAVSDLVTVVFIDGTEPVALQQSAGSSGSPVAVSKLVSPDLLIDPVISADNSGDVTIAGTGNLIVPNQIIRSGDTDTLIDLGTADRILFICGNETLLSLIEGNQDRVKIGDGGDVDINFNDQMFLQGSDGSIGLGRNNPTAERLHIETDNSTAYANTVPNVTNVQVAYANTADGANVFSGFTFGNTGNSQNRLSYMGAISESAGNRKMSFVIGTDNGTDRNERMRIIGDGDVGIGTTSPSAQLHVDQASTSAAQPVLYLDQADVSEEMIEFNTTIGTGNAIEAVGAKTLTTTHFIKVTLPGVFTKRPFSFGQYQAADGQWVVLSNGIKVYFSINNESEARVLANKISFGETAQRIADRLAQAIDDGTDLRTVYFDRGYNSGGSDPIVDGDITSLGITAANLASFITLVEQLQNFADNLTVTEADYDATLNVMRTDV